MYYAFVAFIFLFLVIASLVVLYSTLSLVKIFKSEWEIVEWFYNHGTGDEFTRLKNGNVYINDRRVPRQDWDNKFSASLEELFACLQ